MSKLIYLLFKLRLLSPQGISSLLSAVFKYGINLMALLGIAGKVYGKSIALIDEDETLSYEQLLSQSETFAHILKERYHLKSGHKVGFLCKNHASLIKAIFAVSQTGADIYLLNVEMSKRQFASLVDHHQFDLLIYDYDFSSTIEQSYYSKERLLSYSHDHQLAINSLLTTCNYEKQNPQRSSSSRLVILTGGTTGNPKTAPHKPSLLNYLNPFLTLLNRLNLNQYKTAYIATPIYHGYGVAMLLLFIALGKKVIICHGFEAKKACSLICEHNVEVITVVPLMINKMLNHNAEDLKSLSCVVSGGAELNQRLVLDSLNTLGEVLYNLYGTSEAGLCTIATPKDLNYSKKTVGKRIRGIRLKIVDDNNNEVSIGKVGQLSIKNSWSMKNSSSSWIKTGDLGYRDPEGYYFLCGRVDDMVVTGGENVYPLEVEQVLITHPQVEDVAVIGIDDDSFGQRLKAYVRLKNNSDITKEELLEWLRPRVARFQLPKEISLVHDIPYTTLGKLDKKQLK